MSKQVRTLRLFAALLLSVPLIALLPGCSKTGPAGAKGPEGNANVVVDTFTLVSSQWTYNSQYSLETSPGSYLEYFTRFNDVTDSAVTPSILNTGEVMVFFVTNPISDTNVWVPLPFWFLDGSGSFTYNIAFETMPYTVELEYFFNVINNSTPPPYLASYIIPTYKFKIVVVSGTISTAMQKAGIDKRNYAAVSEYLGLSDRRPLPFSAGAGGNR